MCLLLLILLPLSSHSHTVCPIKILLTLSKTVLTRRCCMLFHLGYLPDCGLVPNCGIGNKASWMSVDGSLTFSSVEHIVLTRKQNYRVNLRLSEILYTQKLKTTDLHNVVKFVLAKRVKYRASLGLCTHRKNLG